MGTGHRSSKIIRADISPKLVEEKVHNHSEWYNYRSGKNIKATFMDVNITNCSFDNLNLTGAQFIRCSLNGLNLSNVTLNMADLTGSDLYDVNLTNASLDGTNFSRANLARSNLSGARMLQVNFSGGHYMPTKFDHANLSGANLTSATLSKASLDHTDMRGCSVAGAHFFGVDVSTVIRLPDDQPLTMARDARTTLRYTVPVFIVDATFDTFTTADWSLTGICIYYRGDQRFALNQHLKVRLAVDGLMEPLEVNLVVTKRDRRRGTVFLRFVDMDKSFFEMLKSFIPSDIGAVVP